MHPPTTAATTDSTSTAAAASTTVASRRPDRAGHKRIAFALSLRCMRQVSRANKQHYAL
jgi:hypothetical protein